MKEVIKMQYTWIKNPYLQMGKKIYDHCVMYDEEGILDDDILPDIHLVRKVMEYVLDAPNEFGCRTKEELIKMLIVNYHMNYLYRYVMLGFINIKKTIDEHYQFHVETDTITKVEDFLREDITENIRILVAMNLIKECKDFSQFQSHLEEKVLHLAYPNASLNLSELFDQDYSLLEELFIGFIKNYVYYFEQDIATFDLDLGCGRYDFYQQKFGNAIISKYQAPFISIVELDSKLYKDMIMKQDKEWVFAQFLYQYHEFLNENYAMVDETYLPSLITYMKEKNPKGYVAITHVLLKTAYLNLRVLPNKTRGQFQLMDKLKTLSLKEEDLAGYNYFFELFSEVVNISSIQDKILEEIDKPYVKKFDQMFKK